VDVGAVDLPEDTVCFIASAWQELQREATQQAASLGGCGWGCAAGGRRRRRCGSCRWFGARGGVSAGHDCPPPPVPAAAAAAMRTVEGAGAYMDTQKIAELLYGLEQHLARLMALQAAPLQLLGSLSEMVVASFPAAAAAQQVRSQLSPAACGRPC